MTISSEYHLKYRPVSLKEIVGQESIVSSLESFFKKGTIPHSICFSGPSGTGKTTFARIIASELKCDIGSLIEMDAATHTGVDDARKLMDGLKYRGMGINPTKFVIIDEAHMLSKSAWNSLLKIVEEPPEHCYFVFCTTEIAKVPNTIQTRCHCYSLEEVSFDDLMDLLEIVVEKENLVLDDKALGVVATEAYGSPRKALIYLSQISGCKTIEDVRKAIKAAHDSVEVIDLCRLLIKGRGITWKKITVMLKKLEGTDPESIRIVIFNYFTKAVMGARSDEGAQRLLQILDLFVTPVQNRSTGLGELLLSLGEIVFMED